MLKGIDPILTPELLMHLCAMGHNEWVAVVDANFTADFLAKASSPRKPLVRLPGLDLACVSRAILSVFPLAGDVPFPVGYMHESGAPPEHRTLAQQAVVQIIQSQPSSSAQHATTPSVQAEAIERFAFYERVKQTSLIVQTGEMSAYGNVLLCKGFV